MTSEEAIARGRTALGESAGTATALAVVRLDGHPPYWLVTIDADERTLGVAAIGDDGELVGSGTPSRPGRHLTVDAARAREIAGAPVDAASRLVWLSSRATASPLFPLWEVTSEGRPQWVALDGALVTELPGRSRGG